MIAMLDIWYAVPLIVTVSFVYGATRHEEPRAILRYTWHTAVWLTAFMVILGGLICFADWML